jgi:hypothetical protein
MHTLLNTTNRSRPNIRRNKLPGEVPTHVYSGSGRVPLRYYNIMKRVIKARSTTPHPESHIVFKLPFI